MGRREKGRDSPRDSREKGEKKEKEKRSQVFPSPHLMGRRWPKAG